MEHESGINPTFMAPILGHGVGMCSGSDALIGPWGKSLLVCARGSHGYFPIVDIAGYRDADVASGRN